MTTELLDKMAELERLKADAIVHELEVIRQATKNLRELGYKRPRLKKGQKLAEVQAQVQTQTTTNKKQKAA